MSTTDLFVELIVIGVGAMAWLALLALSLFGTAWAEAEWLVSLPALLPMLALTYVVGIVTDRLADALFSRLWGDDVFAATYGAGSPRKAYYDDRRVIYLHAERLAGLLEYNRSRLRIARGWAVNAALLLVTTLAFVWAQLPATLPRLALSGFAVAFWLALAVGAWYAWYRLEGNGYRRCQEQASFIRAERS